ncbi:MAG: NAD(P)H-binding protein [Bacteroidales bacterium]|nr:NAD(P)H-binding protein [Bacteroidales bacterium]
MNDNKTAIIFGSTGLIGNCLVETLLHDDNYLKIHLFIRKPIEINHSKIEQHIFDFNHPEKSADHFSADEIFICLGTTIKKAGSVAEVERIDRDYPIQIAEIAYKAGVKSIAIVSSSGANAKSSNYYTRVKGEMEQGILNLNFEKTVIVRPSLLFGKRSEFRLGELIGKGLMQVLSFLFIGKIKKYKGIHARTVAKAMIELIKSPSNQKIFESDLLQKYKKQRPG